ncbi:MAG: glycerol-3-phosphate dehydrogenase [Rhodobacteraceae bacterium]|nr:MAG: glycerol-3-phosphate dehydrogenase [Paracoccaceae bacterium]
MALTPHDIVVIGGGVNGCGIARDAAGRGLSVLLAEMGDLGGATSSWSTKLVHGGLRYLEHHAFRLVREALAERETLMRLAPHLVRPMRFLLPHRRGMRPAWLLRLGLFLYDHIGGRRLLPPTAVRDLRRDPAGRALRPGFATAFEYSDCQVDDARLTVLNARDAADRGAAIRARTRVVRAVVADGLWRVTLRDVETGREEIVPARSVVNAAGPWVDAMLAEALGDAGPGSIRLVQGSHIVIRRRWSDPRAFIFQNADGRVLFAIPWEDDFTLIGTTDRDWRGDPGAVAITPEETAYLCEAASEWLAAPVTPEDVAWSFSGVRPLYDDGASRAQEATRDYVLRLEDRGAPLLSVFGGKLTTYRRLAEAALARLQPALGFAAPPWTAGAPLPGGDFPVDGLDALAARLRDEHPWLGEAHARRLVRLYGRRAWAAVGPADDPRLCADLHATEARFLIETEWARTAEDVLWRRTKLGLRVDADGVAALEAFMAAHAGVAALSAAE